MEEANLSELALIKREDVLSLLRGAKERGVIGWGFAPGILRDVERLPAVDAVLVVRCKNCKHRDDIPGQPNILCGQMHDDDFCSYGERRDDDAAD